jgi:multidrug efflux pump subunit AcrA (membrane-fusion protein)
MAKIDASAGSDPAPPTERGTSADLGAGRESVALRGFSEDPIADLPDTRKTAPPLPIHEEHPHHRHSPIYWLIFVGLLLVSALLVFFFGWLPRHKTEEQVDQEAQQRTHELPKIAVMKIVRAKSASSLQIPGSTLAYTEAYIYARASGYVNRRLVDIGDRVHKGQLLATIDAPDLDKQVAQARSTLEQSISTLEQMQAQLHLQDLNWQRYKVLVAKGVLSRQQGDQQEADFRVADANVQVAQNSIQANRDNLDRLLVLQQYEKVTAPFDGIITQRNVDIGALISAAGSGLGESAPSSPSTTLAGLQGNNAGSSGLSSNVASSTGGAQGGEMFAMASIDPLRILVSVPEGYADFIHVGDQAQLFFSQVAQETCYGTVTRTSGAIDPNTRTLLVEVQTRNPHGRFLPGMYVVVNFLRLNATPPLLVPGEAIVVRNGQTMLAFVDNDNLVHFRPVQLGRDFGNETEITNGLKPGDVIVTIVQDEVRDGGKIDPQYQKTQQARPGGQSDRRPDSEGTYGNQNRSNAGSAAGAGSKTKTGSNNSKQ